MPGILVTDGEQRAALAVVRSLGRAGYQVHVCSTGPRSIAGASRYAARRHTVSDPMTHAGRFAEEVFGIARRCGLDVVIPVADPALLALLERRDDFPEVRIPFPPLETVRAVADKAGLLEEAARLGIATPSQRIVATPDDARRQSLDDLRFPLVLKPARTVAEAGAGFGGGAATPIPGGPGLSALAADTESANGFGTRWSGSAPSRTATPPRPAAGCRIKLRVRYALSPEELRQHFQTLPPEAFPLLLQERIVGPGIGIFLLIKEGRLLAHFSHLRLREKPPSGGVSVFRESIAADPDLVEASRRLLQRYDWEGVAMVEYKREAATGRHVLMEVNGRFWGSLQLAIDAGVDFPRLLVESTLGPVPAPVSDYTIGTRLRWWWGDTDQLLSRLRRPRDELALPPDVPGRGRALADFLRIPGRQDRNEVLRLSDPLPFVQETVDWFRRR